MTTAPHLDAMHPDAVLTLRQSFERHYFTDELADSTLKLFEHTLCCWERHTDNPSVGDITGAVLQAWLESYRADPRVKSVVTIRNKWTTIRSILRALAIPAYGNPGGKGVIPAVPYLRIPRVRLKRPRKAAAADIDAAYLAAPRMRSPQRLGFPPGWFWRTLFCLAYCTGLRRGDLLSIRMEDIDLDGQRLWVQANKTGLADEFYLHPVAVEHIRQIAGAPREFLFGGVFSEGKSLYAPLHELMTKAKIPRDRWFGMQALRRTAASEAEKVRSGAGAILLQHRSGTTARHYLDVGEILRDVIDRMAIPLAMKHGVNMSANVERKERKAQLHVRMFAAPRKPWPEEIRFQSGRRVSIQGGPWFVLSPQQFRLLRALHQSPAGLDTGPLADAAEIKHDKQVSTAISSLRRTLRQLLTLPDGFDPIPRERQRSWTICLPSPIEE